jgi:hypothetical protein
MGRAVLVDILSHAHEDIDRIDICHLGLNHNKLDDPKERFQILVLFSTVHKHREIKVALFPGGQM